MAFFIEPNSKWMCFQIVEVEDGENVAPPPDREEDQIVSVQAAPKESKLAFTLSKSSTIIVSFKFSW